MRVETTTRTLYKFDELTPDGQAAAILGLCDINVDYEWWDGVYDDAEQVGLKLDSFDLDRNSHATGKFILAANEVAQNILNDHGVECETYKTAAAFMEEWQPVFNNYTDETHPDYESSECEDKLLDIEDEFLKSLLEDYRIMLQHEYEYLQSDEAVREMIEANGYEFTADGKVA